MDKIYEWIRSLVSYMILMTVILNLLPDKKYEKYLQLFTGMVFVLLVVSPFTDMIGMEAQMAGAFERITFQTDARLLQKEIEDADGERMARLVEQYEELLKKDLIAMAEEVQAECRSVELRMETDRNCIEFGSLQNVKMVFGVEREASQKKMMDINRKLSELRSRIGESYGMEERDVTIILETE